MCEHGCLPPAFKFSTVMSRPAKGHVLPRGEQCLLISTSSRVPWLATQRPLPQHTCIGNTAAVQVKVLTALSEASIDVIFSQTCLERSNKTIAAQLRLDKKVHGERYKSFCKQIRPASRYVRSECRSWFSERWMGACEPARNGEP